MDEIVEESKEMSVEELHEIYDRIDKTLTEKDKYEYEITMRILHRFEKDEITFKISRKAYEGLYELLENLPE